MSCRYTPFLGYSVYNTNCIDYYDIFQEKAGEKQGNSVVAVFHKDWIPAKAGIQSFQ